MDNILSYLSEVTVYIGGKEIILGPLMVAIIAVALLFVLFLIVFYIFRSFYRRSRILPISLQKIILKVTVPKESSLKHDESKPTTGDEIKSQISVMEAFFGSLGGLRAQRGLKSRMGGREDTFSLEIVAQDGQIVFYLAVPRYTQQYVEQQLQAQYSDAQIEEVNDYNIFTGESKVAGSYLFLSRSSMFPIKTYMKMDVDPLNALTNALSKIEPNDGAVIQVVVRSAFAGWRKEGIKVASAMQQGKTLNEALSSNKGIFMGVFVGIWETFFPPAKKLPTEEGKTHQLSPMETEIVKGLEEKSSKAGLDVNIKVVTSAATEIKAKSYLNNIIDAFNQYNIYEYGNSFGKQSPKKADKIIFESIHRTFNENKSFVFNSEELASIYHLPLPSTETPNIVWLSAKKAAPPVNMPKEGLTLGKCIYRGQETLVKIKDADRRRHVYMLGKSGSGKSFLMTNMARQDVANGKGICIIDPHGDLVDDVLLAIPPERIDDVIVFDPADTERPLGLNLIEYDPNYPEQKTFVVNEMIKIFDKLYDLKATGGPMFEQYMRNALMLLLDDPNDPATLMEVSRVMADADFRREKLDKCNNQIVKDFWEKEAEKAGGEASLANMVPYITSKLTQFIANDIMRPIIGQPKSALNFRQAMDEGKIILVKLSKGRIGEINAHLLGMVIVSKILMAALGRTDVPKDERRDFYLYIDEFQNFTTDSIAIILSEARKYMLNLIIAHQYIGQLVKANDTTIRDAVFGNAGTIASFKIGVEDAEMIAKEFAPVFDAHDVINIEKYTAYIKLLIDNETSRAFNMHTFPLDPGNPELAKKIVELSRLKYGRDRSIVESEILDKIKGFSAVGGGEADMGVK